jgi:alpha-1,3-rhamnosyltransferase
LAQETVTVSVATYNSAKFIIETLDSVADQTYPNIELLISDDCSSDDTIGLCREWLNRHKHRFVQSDIFTVSSNTGVSANVNRCLNAATSQWIKLLAGDDILLPNCIEDNVNYINAHPGIAVVFSQVLLYKNEFSQDCFIRGVPIEYPNNLMRDVFSSNDQYKLLLLSDRINYTPSSFLNKEKVLAVGGFDETIKLVEDYPMWLKLTKAGHKLHYFHTPTVGYRQHEAAVNNMKEEGLFKPLFLKSWPLHKKYIYPNIPWDLAWDYRFVFFISHLFQMFGLNRKGAFNSFLYKCTTVFMNPLKYVIFFKKRLLGYEKNNIFYK